MGLEAYYDWMYIEIVFIMFFLLTQMRRLGFITILLYAI